MLNPCTILKNHFNRHRFAYGVGTGVVTTVVAAHIIVERAGEWKEFAEENVVPHMTAE